MRNFFFILTALICIWPSLLPAQNCCAPAVPQQGVLGETVALPQTLEVGLHYEYLRSYGLYDGHDEIDDPSDKKTVWNRATLTASYGLFECFSLTKARLYLVKALCPDSRIKGLQARSSGLAGEWHFLIRIIDTQLIDRLFHQIGILGFTFASLQKMGYEPRRIFTGRQGSDQGGRPGDAVSATKDIWL